MASEKPDSFQCGPFEVARNPNVSQLVEKLNRLREAVDACRIQPGVGYNVNRSSGGTTLTIKSESVSSPAVEDHPFKLQVRKKDDAYEFKVGPGTVQNNSNQPDNINTWAALDDVPARIYLEAKISELEITSLTFKSQKSDVELKRTEIESGKQTFARITIGLYVPNSTGGTDYRVIQNVTTDIATPLFAFNGYPALLLTQELLNAAE
jgi:hypothetical protein